MKIAAAVLLLGVIPKLCPFWNLRFEIESFAGFAVPRLGAERYSRVHSGDQFFNFYNHDFVRVAVAVPKVRVADPAFNASQTVALMCEAAQRQAVLVLFPELGLSAYSCDDLFHQKALLNSCLTSLQEIVQASQNHRLLTIVGAPIQIEHVLYNCAVVRAARHPVRESPDFSV